MLNDTEQQQCLFDNILFILFLMYIKGSLVISSTVFEDTQLQIKKQCKKSPISNIQYNFLRTIFFEITKKKLRTKFLCF